MSMLYLLCYNVHVCVRCDDAEVLENIRRDFSCFVITDGDDAPDITLTVNIDPPESVQIPPLKASMYKSNCICYDDVSCRYIDYGGRARAIHFFTIGQVIIHSQDRVFLHELTYMTIQTLLGEMLDKKGLHRVHGLGFSFCEQGVLCLMPTGAGKTTLMLNLLKDKRIKLFSEDTPLVDVHRDMYPYPLRIGICAHDGPKFPPEYMRVFDRTFSEPKCLVDIEYFKDQIARAPRPITYIFAGERVSSDESDVRRVNKFAVLRLFIAEGIVCMNVPQYLELLFRLRFREMARVFSNILWRSVSMLRVLLKAQVYRIVLGTDKEKNAATVLDFLSTECGMIMNNNEGV